MRKLYLLIFVFAAFTQFVAAQNYHNEWISFANGQPYSSQQYLRIGVWKEGVYRVSYSDIQTAGISVNSWFDLQKFQVFNNGNEQFIRMIDSDNNNVFSPGDFLEFYGRGNDGLLDAQLYDVTSSQPNVHFSLFNDTAAYFLTYNPFGNGKRMIIETDTNFVNYTAESYYIKNDYQLAFNSAVVSDDYYNTGYEDGNEIADNSYTAGEGFYNYFRDCAIGYPFNLNFNIQKYYSGGTSPTVELAVAGANNDLHPYEIKLGGVSALTNSFLGYGFMKHNIPVTNLVSGNFTCTLNPLVDQTDANNTNKMQVSYGLLTYPRTFDLTGETLPQETTIQSQGNKAFVHFTNINSVNPRMYVFNGDTIKQIPLSITATDIRGLVPVYSSSRRCLLLDNSQVYLLNGNATISPVNAEATGAGFARFTNFQQTGINADYLIVSHQSIWTKATDYKNYRATKGFTPLLADVDELYDQFAWGVRKHPISIRCFADFMIDHFGTTPKYLFLLGKSVMIANSRNGLGYAMNLVPTFGNPASDQMFTSHLNTQFFQPELATGRLAAQNDADVTAYLNKVISFEDQQALPPALWMKSVLHFGGGSNLSEQDSLSVKLDRYTKIIEDTLFGGHVQTFLKNSTNPIQINQSQYLQQQIDSGCTMMTFYGHAAGSSFDINTDDPENYNNKDRYPIVLAQSCFVGDIFSTTRQLNERFVLTPDKGSVGFIAVADKGVIEPLDDYSLRLHYNIFQEMYGKSIGQCMQTTVSQIISPDFSIKGVCMNLTLHGDPALIMNSYSKPDYAITNANVFFTPAQVTTEMDSFKVNIAIANIGKNTSQTMNVLISRIMPDQVSHRDTIFQVPYITYRDTFSIKLPVDFKNGSGLNTFKVTVDVFDQVDEIDNYFNNTASAQLLIGSTDINPVYPQEYAIVPSGSVILKATTANLFAKPRNYRFEVDTNSFFNSIVKKTAVIDTAYGIISWTIPVTLDSNRVYYWRVANDSIMNPDTSISNKFQWRNSSFIYKPGISGWSQADYYQFVKDDAINATWNNTNRQLQYILSQYSVVLTHELYNPSLYINNELEDYGGCNPVPQIGIAVIDSVNLKNVWTADSCAYGYYGNYNMWTCSGMPTCGGRNHPDKYFLFNASDPVSMNSMVDFLQNHIPTGNYILAWNVFQTNFTGLSQNVKNEFTQLGAPGFANLQNTQKFILFAKKGNPGQTQFVSGFNPDSTLRISQTLSRNWNKGFVTSTDVGPALSWGSLHWKYHSLETPSRDSIVLKIVGKTATGVLVTLKDTIVDQSQIVSLSFIDAKQYPYLQLSAFTEDDSLLSPPQIDKWQIYYQPVPEGALNTRFYSFNKDSVQEGQTVNLQMAFQNISNVAMDTLLVDYFIYDANNVRHNLPSQRIHHGIAAGDSVMTSVSFNSIGYRGTNTLWIEANPRNDQPEQYHFNNLASLRFNVAKDITNPLLDVTFDGTHILNQDIVSAKPGIEIQLLDENKFIALNDTADFRVSIKSPSGILTYLNFEKAPAITTDSKLLSWIPATLPKNSFHITYHPQLTDDGIYELDVEATDASGNQSGVNDYKIQFEVINKSTITDVVNYPNPFSTSTRFVFVLTGSEIPNDFRIQIMTITGKIIREIRREEIGNIHIGRNITDYAWNGKDEFGDQLANGVYLYRVITSMNGSNIDHRDSEVDKYFKKGWGKMYLMK